MTILDKFKLDGKVAIVTGTSRGLGQAMAIALGEAGADLAMVGMSDMSQTVRKIESLNRRCVTIKADLSSTDCIEQIVNTTLDKLGSIDILVNNAGITRRAPVVDFTEEDWDHVINVNLRSLFFLSQAVTRVFIKQGKGGKIINIASIQSFQGGILIPAYVASKTALLGLTRLMANELAGHNINVNAIAPGYFSTDLTKPIKDDPKRYPDTLSRIPAGRWGNPEELAGAVVLLASDAGSYMNGFTIAVDGGWLAR